MRKYSMKQHKYNARAGWYTPDLQGPFPKGRYPNLIHFDSQLEVRFARTLELRTRANDILGWVRNYDAWDFNTKRTTPYRANSRIKPDFLYWENDGTEVWVEVKGMARRESLTQISRAIKYFPERKLLIHTRQGTFTPEYYLQQWNRL